MQILQKLNDNVQSYSLKENVFYRFQEMFNDVKNRYQNIGSFILVVDQGSLKVLSSALKMADLIKMGVSSIEKLELKRKEHPNIHAIYYLSPTKESVELLISDFEGQQLQLKNTGEKKKKQAEKDKKKKKKKGKKDNEEDEEEPEEDEVIEEDEENKKKRKEEKNQPKKEEKKKDQPEEVQYGRVHIFFTNKLPKYLLEDIAKSEKLVKRIRTMKEFNHNFYFFEQNGFHLNLEQSLPIIFSKKDSQEAKLLYECISDRLQTVLPALLRFDKISILYNNQDPNSPSNQFSSYFEKKLQESMLRLKESESSYIDPSAGEVYLVIVDRGIDPVTPILHDYSYQSMIYDLLEVDTEKNIVEYEKTELKKEGKETEPTKQVKKYKQQLSDHKDEVFAKFRYLNITSALQGIKEDFEKHSENMQRAKASDKVRSIEDVNKIIGQFPEYNELLQKYAVHFDLIMKCFSTFQKYNLQHNCELEQSLVTGVDDVGKSIKSDKIYASLQDILSRKDIKKVDRLRVALIAFITLELEREQRDFVMSQFEGSEQKLLKNLAWLGIHFLDDKNAAFSRVNQKLVDLSKEKYNAYLTKQKSCYECKKIRGESKKLKKGEEEQRQDCDACGQDYFVFSVMRHTPLSALAIHSVVKQIAEPSFDTVNDFTNLGFGCKEIGHSRSKSPVKVVQPIQQQEDSQIKNKGSSKKNKSSKKKEKDETQQTTTDDGDLHHANEYEKLLEKSEGEDVESLKKAKKVIIFFIGGVSYAEVRAIREFQSNNYPATPIIIGATHVLTHRNYLEGLEQMSTFG